MLTSEAILKVGKKGEIYTNKELREKLGLRSRQSVRAKVENGKLMIEPLPSLKDILRHPVFKTTVKEIEKISEEEQKKYGVS